MCAESHIPTFVWNSFNVSVQLFVNMIISSWVLKASFWCLLAELHPCCSVQLVNDFVCSWQKRRLYTLTKDKPSSSKFLAAISWLCILKIIWEWVPFSYLWLPFWLHLLFFCTSVCQRSSHLCWNINCSTKEVLVCQQQSMLQVHLLNCVSV